MANKIILCQTGARHRYLIPQVLEQSEMLYRLYTDTTAYSSLGKFASFLNKYFRAPNSVKRLTLRIPNIPLNKLFTTDRLFVKKLIKGLFKKDSYEGQSFAAFNNNHERALYLADCFVKIRKYDADIVSCYSNCEEYAALIAGVYNVTLLHSQMIMRSSVLDRAEKKGYLNKLWRVNYSLCDLIKMKHKTKYAMCYKCISWMPGFVKFFLISII